MAKGFYTQGVCLLTDGQTTLTQIKDALQSSGFMIAKERLPAVQDWRFGGPSVIIPFLPAINGYVAVDVVNQPWPDSMGDPKTDPETFGAWVMGQFGPLTFPGGLQRAQQNPWGWPAGRVVPDQHRGFIRIRLSYIFGTPPNAYCIPKEYHPLEEMVFLSRMVIALFDAPGILCYFNPNGEVLRDRASFCAIWDGSQQKKKLALQLWMNVRFFNLNESLHLMDTVGNRQLEVADVEAVFPKSAYKPNDVEYYLRNVTHYLLDIKREMKTGEPIDGPGERGLSWTIEHTKDGTTSPPRATFRLYPKAHQEEIRATLSSISRP